MALAAIGYWPGLYILYSRYLSIDAINKIHKNTKYHITSYFIVK